MLSKIFRLFKGGSSSNEIPPTVHMLTALVELRLKHYEISISFARSAIQQINEEKFGISDAERVYMRCYCTIILRKASFDGNIIHPESYLTEVEVHSGVDESVVRQDIRKWFPI